MEAVFEQSATEVSFSPYKQTKNHPSKRNTRDFTISKPAENSVPTNYIIHGGNSGNGGLFFAPPPSVYFSYPPRSPVLYPPQQSQSQPAQQPPLLPLPISRPRHNSVPSRFSREFVSFPPIARKPNRPQYISPKKSKNPIDKRGEIKRTQSLIGSSTAPSRPDPNYLAKNVSKFLSPLPPYISSAAGNDFNSIIKDLEKFSDSVFTPSPHPSSLPLPKFVKPKLSCTAEASVVESDNGATDNPRRILRLR